jgi:UDP-N-acetylmuramate dehydrogenase
MEIKQVAAQLAQTIPAARLKLNELLRAYTSFKIGGPADILVLPASLDEIRFVITTCRRYKVPVTVFGKGSNLLVRDKGVRGVVVKLDEHLSYLKREGDHIIAGAGISLKDLAEQAAAWGLTGVEFAVGIPGTLGGAVVMNAGAYEGEMKDVLCRVSAVDKHGEVHTFTQETSRFGYRTSLFQNGEYIVVEAELCLQLGDSRKITEHIRDLTQRRESRQPLELPSAGSTFKRPPGYYAGTLIEQTGLKGLRVGGAQVSEKHAGFIVNAGDATAVDVLTLIKEVQYRVHSKFGVDLHPEVQVIGEE